MKKIIIQITLILGLILMLLFLNLDQTIKTVFIGIISGVIANTLSSFNYDTYYFIDLFRSLIYSNTLIRISVAYLIRIKVDNKYLLVKGLRLTHQFQPVGGVYKYYKSASSFLSKMDSKDDDMITLDDYSRNDLRIRIKGKYISKFTNWFIIGKEREVNPSREFYEELIKTEILNRKIFPYSEFEFIKQKRLFKKKSEFYNIPELFIFDIFEVKLSKEQISNLRTTMNSENPNILWASENDIETLGIKVGDNKSACISLTSKYLI